MRGKGLHRSSPERVAHRLGAIHLLGSRAPPKGQAALTTLPSHLDQGQTGTCHAHSFVACLWSALYAKLGRAPAYLGLPCMLASCTYSSVQRGNWTGGPLAPLVDTGAQLQDDVDAAASWGLSPIRLLPTDVPQSGRHFPEPVVSELVEGSADIIGGEYAIPVGPASAVVVAQCLDAGVPVLIGFLCDSAFEEDSAATVRGTPDTTDPRAGGHAVYLSGYRTNADGELEFRLENSWGDAWCDGGGCWVTVSFVEACWSLWPMAVKI